jgi:hypothetical protein
MTRARCLIRPGRKRLANNWLRFAKLVHGGFLDEIGQAAGNPRDWILSYVLPTQHASSRNVKRSERFTCGCASRGSRQLESANKPSLLTTMRNCGDLLRGLSANAFASWAQRMSTGSNLSTTPGRFAIPRTEIVTYQTLKDTPPSNPTCSLQCIAMFAFYGVMPMETLPPDALLSLKKLAETLAACGYPIAESTLASMASRGNGPPFSKFSRRAVYRWDDALDWARGRLTAPVHLTSNAA